MSRGEGPGTRPPSGGVDLHLHSTCSDGLLAPEEVVRLAAEAGLTTIALTDHDTLEGVPAARAEGARRGVEVITGVEVSCSLPDGGERHVLAYGVETDDEALNAALDRNRHGRRERLGRMVEALQAVGIHVSVEDMLAAAPGPSVGRPHVAEALVRRGVASSRQQAFDRWLGDGKIACVPKQNVACEDAIRLIHGAGGIAVLAHPGRKRDREMVEAMAAWGLDGVEVTHPMNHAEDARVLAAMASRLGLIATGGSDCHGDAEGLALMRERRVPPGVAEQLRQRLRSRPAGRRMD